MDSTMDRRVVDWIDGAINLRDFGGFLTVDGQSQSVIIPLSKKGDASNGNR